MSHCDECLPSFEALPMLQQASFDANESGRHSLVELHWTIQPMVEQSSAVLSTQRAATEVDKINQIYPIHMVYRINFQYRYMFLHTIYI